MNNRSATWTTTAASKTYGDSDPSPLTAGSGSNFVAGDGVTATYSRAAGGNASPPTYHITADRKSTRLNSSHGYISYAVFCLKKKKDRTIRGRNSPYEDAHS